jgi:hypothetical protein
MHKLCDRNGQGDRYNKTYDWLVASKRLRTLKEWCSFLDMEQTIGCFIHVHMYNQEHFLFPGPHLSDIRRHAPRRYNVGSCNYGFVFVTVMTMMILPISMNPMATSDQ